jgi:hypothetical protein
MPKLDLMGGYSEDTAKQFNAQTCKNMSVRYVNDEGGKGQYKLKSIIGANALNSNASNDFSSPLTIHDTLNASNGNYYILYHVSGGNFVLARVFGGNTTHITLDATNPSKGKLSENGTVINVVSGGNAYFVDMSTDVSTQITDADFPTTVFDVYFKDGYFIWLDEGTNRFYISSLYATDATNCVNALDFGSVESNPDKVIGITGVGNEIAIFGERTIEFFYNSGNVDFPFERNSGVTMEIGAVDSEFIVRLLESVFFIGREDSGVPAVYELKGYSYKKISNYHVERNVSGAFGATPFHMNIMYDKENYFVLIHRFVSESSRKTMAYNVRTGLWSDLYTDATNGQTWSYPCLGSYNDTSDRLIYVSDRVFKDPSFKYRLSYCEAIGYMFKTVLLEESLDEEYIPIEYTFKHVLLENKTIQVNSLELDVQKGTGDANDTDPSINISISRDGGMTYGNPIALRFGASGDYKVRARADMLGMGRDIVFKISGEIKTQVEIFGAYIDYEVMSE